MACRAIEWMPTGILSTTIPGNSGSHDVKFGYEFRRTTIMQVLENTFRGKLTFDLIDDPNNPSSDPNVPTPKLSPVQAFLEGLPVDGGQRSGYTRRHTSENSHGFYIQDSFRWTPRLTVNLGLRWDYFGVAHEKDGLFYRFDTAAGEEVPAGQLYGKDFNNLPRESRLPTTCREREGPSFAAVGACSMTLLPRTSF